MNYPLDIHKRLPVKMEANRTESDFVGPERFYRNKTGITLCGGVKNLMGLGGQASSRNSKNFTDKFE
jgi:hypothetical protein